MRTWPLLTLLALAACKKTDLDQDGSDADHDCNDRDAAVYLGAPEACNGVDDDCDGFVDEGVSLTAYWDRDGDGYGDDAFVSRVCALPADAAELGGDCDDRDPALSPGAAELCDGVDQDCDLEIDEGVGGTWYTDADGDGHGAGAGAIGGCVPGPGESALSDDCDDADPTAYPGAPEACDGADDDCDLAVDEGASEGLVWIDADADGYGDPDQPAIGCAGDAGVAANDRDCDDGDDTVGPHVTDVQGNGLDEDCDGFVDEYGVPAPYPTLDAALAAAPDGAVVQLDAGTWFEAIDLTGHDVIFAGEGCGETIVYADGLGSAVTMDRGQITGMTLTAGSGTFDGEDEDGGGLLITGDVTATALCVTGNSVSGRGGGAAVVAGTFTVRDSVFDGNYALENGGGIHVARGAALVAERTRFVDNHATGGDGGGVCVNGGTATISNSVFAANVAADDGGGVAIATATDNSTEPETYVRGAGTLDHCTFHANRVTGPTGDESRGQGAYCWGSDLVVTGSVFTGHAGLGEPIEDHEIGSSNPDGDVLTADSNLQSPTFTWSHLGFYDNADQDYDFFWLPDAVHGAPEYVDVSSVDPSSWDLRLLPTSAWIDAGDPAESDPDGSPADLGATGGPGADPDDAGSYLADWDGDGLVDGWEAHWGLDPYVADAGRDDDGDGADALDEFLLGTSPLDADTDADGVDDLVEDGLGADPLRADDQAPLADAGRDQWAAKDALVTLDGAGSWDPNLDGLTWSWALTAPPGSALVGVDDPTAAITTFTPDAAGSWTLTLTVDDGATSRTDTVVVEVVDGVVVPDDFATIQAAIDAATDGDAITVRPGTYAENLVFAGKDLTLVGLGASPADVVIDGMGLNHVVDLSGAEDATLGNLTVANGSAIQGAGIYALTGDVTLSGVVIRDSAASLSGGGIYSLAAEIIATDVTIQRCSADNGGGFWVGNADLTMTNVTIADNHADVAGGGGWFENKISNANRYLTLNNSVFAGNDSAGSSGLELAGNLLTRVAISHTAFVGGAGTSALRGTNGTLQLLDSVIADDASTLYLIAGGSLARWITISVARWDAAATDWQSEITLYPNPLWTLDPAFGLYTADGLANDLLGLRPESALRDAGFGEPDVDGTPSDLGPAGGPDAPRWLRRFSVDADGDGMSDGWEVAFDLDPTADDAGSDADADGRSNGAEYAASTNPQIAD